MAANDHRVLRMLAQVQEGVLSPSDALEQLRYLPYEDLGFAKIDHHRGFRQGLPEVVFGMGKSVEQVVTIVERLAARSDRVLVTRVGEDCFAAVKAVVPDARYHPVARAITVCGSEAPSSGKEGIVLVTAGTADMPVAEEAAVTAELMGHAVARIEDVGIAGIHRLLDVIPAMRRANVIVVVAGMEGALPSVVGGLVDVPIVAVPTSVGYGASFQGLAPLLTMLNSCAPGVSVVNIDNGFGAGYLAALINDLAWKDRPDAE